MESIQQLHAYWRMEYIEAPKPLSEDENIFLNIPKAENDEDVYLLHRGKLTYIVLNRYPYNAGHLLVAPYRQAPTLNDLSPEERADFMDNIILAQDILSKAIKPDGFNTGFNFGSAAGAGVPNHVHCHIVPRWNGDTNFMPVLGNTKVLPQSLNAMWKRLKKYAQ